MNEIQSPFLRGVNAAAAYLGVSVRTINRWMKSNRIPYAKPGCCLLFRRDALDAAMETFTVRAMRREG
jgi:excisionase family DNA binding protein